MPIETVERGFIHRRLPGRGLPGVRVGFCARDGQHDSRKYMINMTNHRLIAFCSKRL